MSETAKRNMSLAKKGKPLHPNSLNSIEKCTKEKRNKTSEKN